MTSATILDLDDPDVRIKAHFPIEIRFDVGLECWESLETRAERALDRVRSIEDGLRGRPIEIGGPVEPVDLDEDRARFVGPMPPHSTECAFDLTPAKIGGDPDCRF